MIVDTGGMGIGMTVGRTLSNQKFLEDPTGAAKKIWEDSGSDCTKAFHPYPIIVVHTLQALPCSQWSHHENLHPGSPLF